MLHHQLPAPTLRSRSSGLYRPRKRKSSSAGVQRRARRSSDTRVNSGGIFRTDDGAGCRLAWGTPAAVRRRPVPILRRAPGRRTGWSPGAAAAGHPRRKPPGKRASNAAGKARLRTRGLHRRFPALERWQVLRVLDVAEVGQQSLLGLPGGWDKCRSRARAYARIEVLLGPPLEGRKPVFGRATSIALPSRQLQVRMTCMPITSNVAWDPGLEAFKGRDTMSYVAATAATATACAACRLPLRADCLLSLTVDVTGGKDEDGTEYFTFDAEICHRNLPPAKPHVHTRPWRSGRLHAPGCASDHRQPPGRQHHGSPRVHLHADAVLPGAWR
jgi:hypothetical protein